MNNRKWKLPGVQELTKDQEAAIACPPKGQHLVIGGPGTGKTVVAMLQARQFHNQNVEYTFLVYNHMLHEASKQMAEEWFDNGSSTYIQWFCKLFSVSMGSHPPKPTSQKYFDWEWCMDEVDRKSIYKADNKAEVLLIDEGQDMPPEFYKMLIKFGYENFFVAADQNQQISDNNSSRKEIEDQLAIETHDVIELKQNFRNNLGIARLAREFYTGDPASPLPELPPARKGESLHVPKLYTFQWSEGVYERIAEAIAKFFERAPQKLICVLTPNNDVREMYFKALKSSVDRRQKNFSVQTYSSGGEKNIRFDRGGIIVLNAQSCKGLEFDVVILADINQHIISHDHEDDIKKLFYVMISRARDKVFLIMMKKDPISPIQDILPKDESVLCWEDDS